MTHPEAPATPVQAAPDPASLPEGASLGRRLVARVVDFGVWIGVLFVLDRVTPDLVVLGGILWSLVWLVLPLWRGGATAGKRLCRIRVVRAGGGPLSLLRAFFREAFVLASIAIPVIGVLNVLAGINDPRPQSLHDKVTDTLAVGRFS